MCGLEFPSESFLQFLVHGITSVAASVDTDIEKRPTKRLLLQGDFICHHQENMTHFSTVLPASRNVSKGFVFHCYQACHSCELVFVFCLYVIC
jgi:hypothetical protein